MPGHLAGPGAAAPAFQEFLDAHRGWLRFAPDGGDTTVAVHEDLCARIQLDHEPPPGGPRWTVVAYDCPVGDLAWTAEFDTRTPHEIPLSLAASLSYALSHGSPVRRDREQWGVRPTHDALVGNLRASGWQDLSTDARMEFRSPDGTASLVRRDRGAHHRRRAEPDAPAPVTLQGGTGEQQWRATFTTATPTLLITAALAELTEPLTALRRLSEVPHAHRHLVTVHRTQAHFRPAAATSRSAYTTAPRAGLAPGAVPPLRSPTPAPPARPTRPAFP
ncbi:DUF317 domain-containing protein [Kitasatospora sp. NPDC001574]